MNQEYKPGDTIILTHLNDAMVRDGLTRNEKYTIEHVADGGHYWIKSTDPKSKELSKLAHADYMALHQKSQRPFKKDERVRIKTARLYPNIGNGSIGRVTWVATGPVIGRRPIVVKVRDYTDSFEPNELEHLDPEIAAKDKDDTAMSMVNDSTESRIVAQNVELSMEVYRLKDQIKKLDPDGVGARSLSEQESFYGSIVHQIRQELGGDPSNNTTLSMVKELVRAHKNARAEIGGHQKELEDHRSELETTLRVKENIKAELNSAQSTIAALNAAITNQAQTIEKLRQNEAALDRVMWITATVSHPAGGMSYPAHLKLRYEIGGTEEAAIGNAIMALNRDKPNHVPYGWLAGKLILRGTIETAPDQPNTERNQK